MGNRTRDHFKPPEAPRIGQAVGFIWDGEQWLRTDFYGNCVGWRSVYAVMDLGGQPANGG